MGIKRSPGCKCCDCGTLCVRVIGCGTRPLAGASVTIKIGTTVIATGTTTGQLDSLTLTAGGSGYTNGTGYALGLSGGGGSGASGTFDVVSGHVANLQITAGGSGYTSAPAVSFPGAGAGAGATATAGVVGKVCFPISSAATYTVVVTRSRFNTSTTTVVATCSGMSLTTTTVTLTAATGYHCCNHTDPYPDTLYVTDANGTYTLTRSGSTWGPAQYSAPGTHLCACVQQVVPPFAYVPDCTQPEVASGTVEVAYEYICDRLTMVFREANCSGFDGKLVSSICSPSGAANGQNPSSPAGPMPQTFTFPSTQTSAFGGTVSLPVSGTVTVSE